MFEGVEVFSATVAVERERLGERVTQWMRANRHQKVVLEKEVKQSSDSSHHCLTILLYWRDKTDNE